MSLAEQTDENSKKLMDAFLRVIVDDKKMEEGILHAGAVVLNRTTEADIPGFRFTWFLNGDRIGDQNEVTKPNLNGKTDITWSLKVVATLPYTGSLVKTATFTVHPGERTGQSVLL